VAGRLKLTAKGTVIVDLAIEHHPNCAIFVRHRLVAGSEIDDGQPAETERYIAIRPEALIIRPAVWDRIRHGLDPGRRIGMRAAMEDACYATHELDRLGFSRRGVIRIPEGS
jgi:hypothetical protein